MREELDEKLKARFPFYTGALIRYGFPGDGWFQLLWDLSEKIEKCLEDQPLAGFEVVQVKEKFGTLRYYTSHYRKDIHDCIREAESASARTCEECGEPGKIREGGWIRTLCDNCHEEREEERKKAWEEFRSRKPDGKRSRGEGQENS